MEVVQETPVAHCHLPSLPGGDDACPGDALKCFGHGQVHLLLPGGVYNGLAQGMFRHLFTGSSDSQKVLLFLVVRGLRFHGAVLGSTAFLVLTRGRQHSPRHRGGFQFPHLLHHSTADYIYIGHLGLSLCDSPCLIQYDSIHLMANLQGLSAFNQNTVPGSHSGSHHNGRGRGKPQRTGAGNDQYGHEYGQHKGKFLSSQYPPQQGRHQGNSHDCGNKVSGHLIRQLGDRGLLALGILDHLNDFRQGGIASHMGHFYLHGSIVIHASADHAVPWLFLHRDALSGKHGFIHAAAALYKYTIQGYPAARFYKDMLTHRHQGGLHFPFHAVLIENSCVRRQLHELAYGLRCLSLTAALHEFAQHDQGDHHGRRLVIQLVGLHVISGNAKGHHKAVDKCAPRTNGHQGIHVGIALKQGTDAYQIELTSANKNRYGQYQLGQGKIERILIHLHERRQGQGKGQHMTHGNVEQRHRKTDSCNHPALHSLQLFLLLLPFLFFLFLVLFFLHNQAGRKTRLGYLLTNHFRCHLTLVIGNHHAVGRQIHITALHTV